MPDNNDQKELTAKIGFLEAELDSLSAKLRGMSATGGGDQEERYGWSVPIYKSSLNLSKFAFGCTVSGTAVSVTAGQVLHAGHPPYTATSGMTAWLSGILTADHQYVWVEYNLSNHEVFVRGPSTAEPRSDAQIFRVWLAQFRLINGAGSIERIGHIGNIIIPSYYE